MIQIIPNIVYNGDLIEQIIIQSIGHGNNDYLKRLMTRYLNQPIEHEKQPLSLMEILRPSDWTLIKQQLLEELNHQKIQLQLGIPDHSIPFMINALMNEKLDERKQLLRAERHKLWLSIGLLVIPIISNLIQFLITYPRYKTNT
jgi:hypothetical protein